jgi:hypothetical protein
VPSIFVVFGGFPAFFLVPWAPCSGIPHSQLNCWNTLRAAVRRVLGSGRLELEDLSWSDGMVRARLLDKRVTVPIWEAGVLGSGFRSTG